MLIKSIMQFGDKQKIVLRGVSLSTCIGFATKLIKIKICGSVGFGNANSETITSTVHKFVILLDFNMFNVIQF